MRTVIMAGALTGALLVAGCDEQDKAERAAEIAAEIEESPDQTEEILADHDMTIEQFESLMYEVAADPELSERYEAEREQ